MTANTSHFNACVLILLLGEAERSYDSGEWGEALGVPVYLAAARASDATPGCESLLLTGSEEPLLESLVALAQRGFSHALVVEAPPDAAAPQAQELLIAAEGNPSALHLLSPNAQRASAWTRLGLRAASGLRLQSPYSRLRCYPLSAAIARHCVMNGATLDVELLIKLFWAGVPILELASPLVPVQRAPSFSLRRLHMFVRLINLHWFLPPTFLEMATRRDFHALSKGDRLRESFREVFLREPGSSGRIAASAGLGFFLALTPLWGFQILLTIYLTHRLKLSKTVALVCAQISIPPLIPLALYASLVLGRTLMGVESGARPTTLDIAPADLWPWIVGSFALASIAGLLGSTTVWILVSGARRLRKRSQA